MKKLQAKNKKARSIMDGKMIFLSLLEKKRSTKSTAWSMNPDMAVREKGFKKYSLKGTTNRQISGCYGDGRNGRWRGTWTDIDGFDKYWIIYEL